MFPPGSRMVLNQSTAIFQWLIGGGHWWLGAGSCCQACHCCHCQACHSSLLSKEADHHFGPSLLSKEGRPFLDLTASCMSFLSRDCWLPLSGEPSFLSREGSPVPSFLSREGSPVPLLLGLSVSEPPQSRDEDSSIAAAFSSFVKQPKLLTTGSFLATWSILSSQYCTFSGTLAVVLLSSSLHFAKAFFFSSLSFPLFWNKSLLFWLTVPDPRGNPLQLVFLSLLVFFFLHLVFFILLLSKRRTSFCQRSSKEPPPFVKEGRLPFGQKKPSKSKRKNKFWAKKLWVGETLSKTHHNKNNNCTHNCMRLQASPLLL